MSVLGNLKKRILPGGRRQHDARPATVIPGAETLRQALSRAESAGPERRRLILHAGTPKTGSTSLQSFLDQHRADLLDQGVLYPLVDNYSPSGKWMPKHQWFVSCLLKEHVTELAQHLSAALQERRNDTHTIILSSEGIFNHWWDISRQARGVLPILCEFFDVRLWAWFRDPHAYVLLYYKQVLKHPRFKGAPPCYGSDLSLDEFLDDEWFRRRLDYLGFVEEVEALIGQGNVDAMPYTADIISKAMEKLEISGIAIEHERENESLSLATSELLRVINRFDLNPTEKAEAVELTRQLDLILSNDDEDEVLPERITQKITRLTAPGLEILENRYGLQFDDLDPVPGKRENTSLSQSS